MEVYRFQWIGTAWNKMSWLQYCGPLYIFLSAFTEISVVVHLLKYLTFFKFSMHSYSESLPKGRTVYYTKCFVLVGISLLCCLGFFFSLPFNALFRKATLKSNAVLGSELCLQLILPSRKGLIFTKIIYIFWYLLSTSSSH